MNPLTQIVISQIPVFFDMIREAHAAANPGAPAVTSKEVLATLESVFSTSIERDETLRAVLRAELGLPPV